MITIMTRTMFRMLSFMFEFSFFVQWGKPDSSKFLLGDLNDNKKKSIRQEQDSRPPPITPSRKCLVTR